MVLGPRGAFLATVAGRGEGPGELQSPRGIFPKGDSLAISVLGHEGLHLYDQSLRYIRTIPVPLAGLSQALFMRGDTLVVTYQLSSEESFGLPFHVYSRDGDWVRSFGDEDRSVRRDFAVRNRRVISRASDSTFWSARYDVMVFEEWDLEGRLIRRIQPSLGWFTPLTEDHPGFDTGPMPAQVLAIHVVSPEQILAIFIRPRDPDGSTTVNRRESSTGVESAATALNNLSDWLIQFDQEVNQVLVSINPTTGSVVAQVPVSGALLLGFLSDSLMFGVHLDEDGVAIPVTHRVPALLPPLKEN